MDTLFNPESTGTPGIGDTLPPLVDQDDPRNTGSTIVNFSADHLGPRYIFEQKDEEDFTSFLLFILPTPGGNFLKKNSGFIKNVTAIPLYIY